jgi:hypothetical protein
MNKLIIGTDYGYLVEQGTKAIYLGNSIFQMVKADGLSYRHSSYFFAKAIAEKL